MLPDSINRSERETKAYEREVARIKGANRPMWRLGPSAHRNELGAHAVVSLERRGAAGARGLRLWVAGGLGGAATARVWKRPKNPATKSG